jgi:DNA-binding PadR family transcriptional regulator
MSLPSNSKWLLVLIGATRYVEGSTRLQKYGLLTFKKIGNREEFFSDWRPDKFGVFSKSLAQNLTMLVDDKYVTKDEVTNTYGKTSYRYRITDKGRNEIQDLINVKKDVVEDVCGIAQYYFDKSTKEVLADVYTLYPEYTTNSTIKHEVNKNKIDQETLFEESEFDIPSDQAKHLSFDLTNLVTRNAPEHVFNDEDTREKLAKEIGLRGIPKLDATAFDRLAGMFGKKIKLDKIDAVETVRAIRGS